MSAEPPAFPRALDDDDDDVAWALQTAAVQWERGGVADAIVWLKRAAEAAVESGKFARSGDIQRRANELDRWLQQRPKFPLQPDDDDGVDSLLATDAPEIEAGAMTGPSPSLVDVLEAEERGELDTDPLLRGEGGPVRDLEDMQDVEDIEAVDLDDFEARQLDGYGQPLEEITQARSSVSERARAPASARSRAPTSTRGRPPTPQLPLPKPRTLPPLSVRDDRREGFGSEPGTTPRSERSNSVAEDPTATPIFTPSRARVESLPEVSATELDVPTLEPPPPLASSEPPPEVSIASIAPISAAAPSELEAAVQVLFETPPPPPPALALDLALVAECRGLEDLPSETQAELARKARVETLGPEQEVSDFGLALVVRGSVVVMPTIAEGACGRATRGQPVFSRGTLSDGVALRVVAQAEGAEVAVWRPEDFEHVLTTCPWVADELRAVADRYQALAGAAMGLLGERLDDSMRAMLTDRCELKVLTEGEVLIEAGKPPPGLFIVGGGRLELVVAGVVQQELGPGDLPFAGAVLTHEPAAGMVRAAAGGALVLHADRMATHELIVGVPPLLELLSMV